MRRHSQPPRRWSDEETQLLARMRAQVEKGEAYSLYEPKTPDLVGDRRLLRFLRSCSGDADAASIKYLKSLEWRRANEVDKIRENILYTGLFPRQFPHGAKIIDLLGQITIAPHARDKSGNPISMERFNFCPSEALKLVAKEEFMIFFIYCLEYKTLVLEQLSDEAEKEKMRMCHEQQCEGEKEGPVGLEENEDIVSNSSSATMYECYGTVLASFYLRDFEGFSLDHVSGDGQKLVQWALEISQPNYPELLHKSHMIRVPWVFNVLWIFVRPFLDHRTAAKVHLHGYNFLETISDEIDLENIPEELGGGFSGGGEERFAFNLEPGGPFVDTLQPRFEHEVGALLRIEETEESYKEGQREENEAEEVEEEEDGEVKQQQVGVVLSTSPVKDRSSKESIDRRNLFYSPYAWFCYFKILLLVPITNFFFPSWRSLQGSRRRL